ncbi:Asp-tRNAAsn/Glu-tRNAGln amidotransferase A subunit [Dietzia kunjamensis subsp. schimae]|uniref:amidase n=1 Tax=Dietzia kunjamensis subsp. schimae TaxID=498198 RepID=A0ABY1N3I9_9ACTN|nr:amidase [Dietzia kunjamensis]MBB1014072.1 amidase [Dietzia kunjamensis subsp. schimae]SMO84892.1 Asp-tRNAAsn/Glu-tRNAGln amidotransferase A subunit [Dietzia kunjamensis subsp. schimae]
MRFDEFRSHDALGLAALVRRREATPVELLDAAVKRADSVNPGLNAIVHRMDGTARDRAAGDLTGPFAGVPFLLKDLGQDYAGSPTSGGSRPLVGVPAVEHATVVQRWLDAGLVVFGKTNTPEFGAKGITEPELFGPARNPWDTSRSPGGSSGGSAAAVAAGIVPAAGASDGGGSIRIPAACCGLVGLKPGRGLVPMGPLRGEAMHGAATNGVVSRSVRDTAAMLDVLMGGEPGGPYVPATPSESFLSQVGADPGRLRIGVCTASSINPEPHPEALAAVENAARTLEDLGHHVEILDAQPVDDFALARDFLTSWFAYLAWSVEDTKRRTGCADRDFETDTRIVAALGRAQSSVDYLDAVMRRDQYVRELTTYFDGYDLLMTPTLADLPPRIGALDTPPLARRGAAAMLATRTASLLRHSGFVESLINANLSWVPYTQLANLTGRPAMSLPLHWTPEGVPMGVHFTAQLGGESTLLRLAGQLEQSSPWSDRNPALNDA